MSIRFRCAYCNQLMAIGTRKAGSVVHCTKCHNALVVPAPENSAGAAAPQPNGGRTKPHTPVENVFEHNDFGDLFTQQVPSRPQALQPPLFSEASAPTPAPPQPAASFIEYEAIPLSAHAGSGRGIHIPAAVLAAVCVAMVVLLGLAFLLGLLVGRNAH